MPKPAPAPDDTPDASVVPPTPRSLAGTPAADAARVLGFDPDRVRAVVMTADGARAVAADYPEPYVIPATEETS